MLDTRDKLQFAGILFFVFTTYAGLSHAEPGGRGDPGSPQGGPPPEAIEACAELAESDACSFTGRRGEEVAGSCIVPQQGRQKSTDQETTGQAALACAPAGGEMRPPRPGMRPE